jgi:outer membrane protein assembly factor BamD (BamD/ComL family)
MCCGCALNRASSASPPLPGAAVKDVGYEPPVPLAEVPQNEQRPDSAKGWDKFTFDHFNETFKAAVGRGPNELIARKYYAEADDFYRHKKYHDAAGKYEAAADRWPDTSLEEDALFMCAESHFFADEYSKAEDVYEELAKKYSNTRYQNAVVARQYAIAMFWQQYDQYNPHWMITPNFFDKTRPMFDTWGYANRTYDQVRIGDPRGPYADEAIWNTANAHFLKHHWEDAAYYYKLIRTDYPKSKHQLDAHLLGIQCKLRSYQGPGYDDHPLKDAEQLIDHTLVQFGTELGDERPRLVTAKGEIHFQLALRDYQFAQFYDKGEHYAAARLYYSDIVKNYPQTKLSDVSQLRLAQIEKLPDNPSQPVNEFLAKVFDGTEPESTQVARTLSTDGQRVASRDEQQTAKDLRGDDQPVRR